MCQRTSTGFEQPIHPSSEAGRERKTKCHPNSQRSRQDVASKTKRRQMQVK